MESNQKLYVVVRADLTYGQQMAQAIHAFREFGAKFPEQELDWYLNSNYICVLQVPTAHDLLDLKLKTAELGFRSAWFLEPAYGNSVTAIAFEPTPEMSKFLQYLPLAGKDI